MAPVSNKALVVIVFPITIGILQSWWITYFAGAKKIRVLFVVIVA